MKDLKTYIIIALFIWIVLFYTCNKPKVVTETKTVTRVDSLFFRDTIEKIVEIPRTRLILVDSTQNNTILSDFNDTSVFSSTYTYNYTDSLLDALIYVSNDSRPYNVELEYKMKQFTLKDSVYVRDSVYNEVKKSFLSVGATVLGSKNSFGFAPMLQYNHKKGNNYSIGYDVINGNFHVGFSKKLSFR